MKKIFIVIFTVVLLMPVMYLQAEQTETAELRNIFAEDARDKQNEKMIQFLERANPERAKELKMLKQENPDQFYKEMDALAERMREKLEKFKKEKENDAVTRASDNGDWQQPRRPRKDNQQEAGQQPKSPPPPEFHMQRDGRQGKGRNSYMEVMKKRNEEFLEWLNENFPEQAEKLSLATEANPERAFRDMMPTVMMYRDIFETEKKNPELAALMKQDVELKQRRNEVVERLSITEGKEEREELAAHLEDIVAARFDLILEKRQMRFDELRQRLAELEEQIAKQQSDLQELSKQRDAQIKKRVDELMAEKEQMIWE
ncbi:MAG: hypothetical protein ACIAQZ_13060 [Sedimentisphaeraceae bacterium JB056]